MCDIMNYLVFHVNQDNSAHIKFLFGSHSCVYFGHTQLSIS
jgi:hypothetical protein